MPVDIEVNTDPSDTIAALKKVVESLNSVTETNKGIAESIKQVTQESEKSEKAQKKAGLAARAWKSSMDGLVKVAKTGVATLGAALAKSAFDTYQHIRAADALSKALEVTTQRAQSLAIAEKEAGLSKGSVQSAIESLAVAQGRQADELRRMGFSFDEIRSTNAVELFDQLAERIHNGSIGAIYLSDAITVLGGDTELVKALTGEFSELEKQAIESGRVIEDDVFEKAVNGSRNLSEAIKDLSSNVTENLVAAFEYFDQVVNNGVMRQLVKVIDYVQGAIVHIVSLVGGISGGLSFGEAAQFAEDEAVNFLRDTLKARQERIKGKDSRSSDIALSRQLGEADRLAQLSVQLGAKPQVDSLARVGLFAGEGQREGLQIQRRTFTFIKKMEAHMEKVRDNTKQTADKI